MEGEGLDFGDSPAPAVEMEQPLTDQGEALPGHDIGKSLLPVVVELQ